MRPRRGDNPRQYKRAEADEAGRGGWRRGAPEEQEADDEQTDKIREPLTEVRE